MDRKSCEIISKYWIFANPYDPEAFDAAAAQKREDFRKAGLDDTIELIDQRRACDISGIHLYALNKCEDVAYIVQNCGIIHLI